MLTHARWDRGFPVIRFASPVSAIQDGLPGTQSALSRHQVEVLHKCRRDTAIGELMSIAGRSDRTKFRNQVLRPLLAADLLRMTVPEKPNSRLQKYGSRKAVGPEVYEQGT